MAEEFPFRYIPPVDPNIGRRFGRYIVRMLLGRGGMGAAYLAEHEAQADVKCVIKFVLAELAQNPMGIRRYKTETEAVSRLKHDNIVKLQDFGVLEDGQLFMCFEYIEGKSLDRYVVERGGRLDIRKAANFIFQLCDALQYAHERGVVHRDLKPDNLMIEVSPPGSHLDERVKILDFGIAKVANTSEHTGSGMSMGTPRHMAPEQVTNAAAATSAADVFSLATILYLLVTGTLPWGMPESDAAIYHLQRTEAPAWPSEDVMPHDVAAVVMRALSIKPTLRPSMREFALEIAAAIPQEGDLESGTEILQHVKRSWVKSSLPHAQTLPRPVAADPTATVSAASLAPEVVSPGVAMAERLDLPQAPVLAALPTGLLSQRFAAQEPQNVAGAARTESVIVAAEIDLASGTPGPQPYAHAELPAVLVSNTQLSAAPAAASAAVEHPARSSELAPLLVLPGASRSPARRNTLVLSAVACALTTAAVVYAVARRDSPAQQSYLSSPADDRIGSAGSAAHSTALGAGQSAIAITEPAHPPAEVTARASIRPVNVAETGGGSAGPAAVAPRVADDAATQRPQPPSHAALAPAGARAAGTGEAELHPDTPVADPPRSPSPRGASSVTPKAQQVAPTKKTGELAVLVKPWALLWLNGKPMNQTPYRETIPAGRYYLRLKNDDLGKDESLVVTVSPDHTTIIERKW